MVTVRDWVTAHLLGHDRPDVRLAGMLDEVHPDPTAHPANVRRAATAAGTGIGLVHLRSRGGDAAWLAVAALRNIGPHPLALDTAALARRPGDVPEVARLMALEARLTGAAVVLGPLQALPGEPAKRARFVGAVVAALRGIPLMTHGSIGWDAGGVSCEMFCNGCARSRARGCSPHPDEASGGLGSGQDQSGVSLRSQVMTSRLRPLGESRGTACP
ncbi:hypothetical protein [Streptomyces naphthomycinicus]|uniref:hypothetical protein n=1 Tax=Streptomyces naphthomycinicus TaxID=2872625 RepID=UPI001CECCF51|nr:hypothetical protein [Streptomyces sp. TML10]